MNKFALSIDETAAFLGVGRTKTYQLIGCGQFRSFRIGRRRLVVATDVETFVQRSLGN